MNYSNNSTSTKASRIKDFSQINYARGLLEASAQQCLQQGVFAPEFYLANAQNLANNYSQSGQYPVVTFNLINQPVRGSQPVPEITATINGLTSSSYFLLKDSQPKGRVSKEQLVQLRPDVVAGRISAQLGLTTPQATPVSHPAPPIANQPQPLPNPVPPIPNQTVPNQVPPLPNPVPAIPNQTASNQVLPLPNSVPPIPNQTLSNQPQPLPNPVPAIPNQTASNQVLPLPNSVPPIPNQTVSGQEVNHNPYQGYDPSNNQNIVSTPNLVQPDNGHNFTPRVAPQLRQPSAYKPQQARSSRKLNRGLEGIGDLSKSMGQLLKDMAQGSINPVQLYGDTLLILGNFIKNIPAGVRDARLNKIVEQIKLIEDKKTQINDRINTLGDELIGALDKSESDTQSLSTSNKPRPQNRTVAQSTLKKDAPSSSKISNPVNSNSRAIDQLLKSNATLDDKLSAVEQTVDKMLEELVNIERSLNLIALSLESNDQEASLVEKSATVLESESETDVEVKANEPRAEVAFRTDINTEITVEAKTEAEAATDTEVPEIEVDNTPEVDQNLIDLISNHQGDLDKINDFLQQNHHLTVNLTHDGYIAISNTSQDPPVKLFESMTTESGTQVYSTVKDETKLSIMEKFVAAESLALNSYSVQHSKIKSQQRDRSSEVDLSL